MRKDHLQGERQAGMIENVRRVSGQALRGKGLSGGECEEERLAHPFCLQDVCDAQVDGKAPTL